MALWYLNQRGGKSFFFSGGGGVCIGKAFSGFKFSLGGHHVIFFKSLYLEFSQRGLIKYVCWFD